MLALNHDCLTQLNPQLQPPLYCIGQRVTIGEAPDAERGVIIGLKLHCQGKDSSWDYLIEFDPDTQVVTQTECAEDWGIEAELIPLDGSSLLYQQRWSISAKAWGDEFLYEVLDLETEVKATGLRLFSTPLQAVIAGKHFVQRELMN